jgi:hypothetical protein
MADPRKVSKLLGDLHDSKIVNLDSSIRSVLGHDALGDLAPGSTVASAVVAWDGYGLVIKGAGADLEQVQAIASTIAQRGGGGGG